MPPAPLCCNQPANTVQEISFYLKWRRFKYVHKDVPLPTNTTCEGRRASARRQGGQIHTGPHDSRGLGACPTQGDHAEYETATMLVDACPHEGATGRIPEMRAGLAQPREIH